MPIRRTYNDRAEYTNSELINPRYIPGYTASIYHVNSISISPSTMSMTKACPNVSLSSGVGAVKNMSQCKPLAWVSYWPKMGISYH